MPCPGCGLTRAVARLFAGDLRGAVSLHPLAPLLAAETLIVWLVLGERARRGVSGLPRWLPGLALGTAAVAVVVWGVRLASGAAT